MKNEIQPIRVGNVVIAPGEHVVMAGPCAVEGHKQMNIIAEYVARMGVDILRGGAFKPRTNPASFRGLGEEGLGYLFDEGRTHGMPVVTEVMRIDQIKIIQRVAAGHPFMWQIGSRNAQNYDLLEAVGNTGIPVLLKRGKGSTIGEMLSAASYVKRGGSPVVMCERGIVSFSSGDPLQDVGRFTPDHLAVLRFEEEGLMTIFDPSHAAGRSGHVTPLALSGVAIGAHGMIVETHHNACEALCDKNQALSPQQFELLMLKTRALLGALNVSVRELEVSMESV